MHDRCRSCSASWYVQLAPAGDLCDGCVLRVCRCIAGGVDAAPSWPWRVRSVASMGEAEASTHLDLALAYVQMGLLGDALVEAAAAVIARADRDVISSAWRLIVDPRLCDDAERVYALARRLAPPRV